MSKQQRFDHTTIGEYIAKECACLNIAISINNWCREWSRYIRGYVLIIYIYSWNKWGKHNTNTTIVLSVSQWELVVEELEKKKYDRN